MRDLASHATVAKPETAARTRQIVCNEIRLKWGKFSDQDLSALKDNSDLVTQRAAKYGLEKAQAERDVNVLMKGRQI
jgi:hypothetical protein